MDSNIKNQIDSQCSEAEKFCDELYNSIFAAAFKDVTDLYKRMKSDTKPITDEELTYIITTLPLELFTISEALNKLRLKLEVAKLENTRRELEQKRSIEIRVADTIGKSQTLLSQIVKDETITYMTEYKIYEACYSSVITRVENQIAYSRELIMGAKKIWDSRRASEASNPISPVNSPDLPMYQL